MPVYNVTMEVRKAQAICYTVQAPTREEAEASVLEGNYDECEVLKEIEVENKILGVEVKQ